jgi:hypothetical protein
MTRRGRRVATGLLGVLLIGVGYLVVRSGAGPLPDPQECSATAADHTVDLSTEQAENASLMAAIAERRNLPARAISIAIATAYQESKLRNIDHGDRDSLGLFQQRPSQGWGTEDQIMDPYYSINAFYDELVKIDGYQNMQITEAAQAVQRSAFPDAYADHEQDGRTIASAMSGYSEAAFSCEVARTDVDEEELDQQGLTERAQRVRRDMAAAFGDLPLGGFEPGGVTDGHMEGSAHYEGRAIDVFFRPVNETNRRRGWVLAHYLVANADRLDVDHVIFDDRIWTAGDRSRQGWRDYDPGADPDASAETLAILEHRDHVHVDVR